jgi:CBS domain-containing protein
LAGARLAAEITATRSEGRMKSIRQILGGQNTVTVGRATPVVEAARLMAARHIGAVPVVEGSNLVGIFSERDALTRILAAGLDPARTPVGDVMSTSLVVAQIDECCEACLGRMRAAHIRHLIVLDEERMAGVLSMRDLLAVDLEEKVENIALLNAYIHHVPGDITTRPD